MATVRISEADLARDVHAVLAQVREGVEVIVESEERPVAVIKAPEGPGRRISEAIALARRHERELGYAPVPDAEFAADVQAAVDERTEGLTPPKWD
jgi:antitoxin (DNA-binding transcriptional repressor) of toxin-antitoxin stability system